MDGLNHSGLDSSHIKRFLVFQYQFQCFYNHLNQSMSSIVTLGKRFRVGLSFVWTLKSLKSSLSFVYPLSLDRGSGKLITSPSLETLRLLTGTDRRFDLILSANVSLGRDLVSFVSIITWCVTVFFCFATEMVFFWREEYQKYGF